MRFRLPGILLAVLAWLGLAAGLVAQESSSGNVHGQVLDEKGTAVPSASVILTGASAPSTTVADVNGRFHFLALPPGQYQITATAKGFAPVTRENVIVTLGKNTTADVTMVSGVAEAVTVTSSTPLIDERKTETGITFAQAELQQIPTTRDIYAYMQQVPGIQLDRPNTAGIHSADVGGPSFTSKGSSQSTYTMDGVTITDNNYGSVDAKTNGASPVYFDFDTFQELQISTGGSNLEIQTPGASINVVTKRGTNDIKGSARFYYTSDKFQADNTSDEARAQGLQTDSLRFVREYGAEVGGPILKDRLWIWGAFARQDFGINRTGLDALGNALRSDIKLEPYNAKLNLQIVSANAMDFFFSRSNRTELGSGGGSTRPPETRRDLLVPTNIYKVSDSQVFSPSLFATANYAYATERYDAEPVGGRDTPTLWANDQWNMSYRWLTTKQYQQQGNLSGSKFFNTGNVGHELKFGFGYRHQVNDSASAWPGQQVFGSELSSSSYAVINRGVITRFEQEYMHTFAGDTLTIGNLTVNAGLRYDYQRGRNLASTGIGNPQFPDLLPTVHTADDPNHPFQFHDLEPRVSATYSFGKDKKTLARVSYSRFADQLGRYVYQLNGFPRSGGLYYYWDDANHDHIVQTSEVGDPTGGYYGVNPLSLPDPPNHLAPNFRPASTDEVVVGLDHQLMEDFAVSAAYTYRSFNHLQYIVPTGADATTWTQVASVQGSVTAANGLTVPFNVPFYGLTLDETPSGNTYLNRPGWSQTFHGVDLQLNKRLSHNWMARASFAWQDWKQNLTAESILNPNNDWYLGNPNTDGGIATGYGAGTISFNARWQVNVTGLYQAPFGINVGANFFGREGNPASYYVRARIRSGNIAGALPEFDVRNTIGRVDDYRLDNVYELDMRFDRPFKIGEVSIIPSVDIFNVTNADTVLQRTNEVGRYTTENRANNPNSSFVPNARFNRIVETQNPRVLRVGLRVAF
ncbi:MAG: TonB-dependent receptor [Acidobacteriota bacterium]